ncbi:MAG: pilus assembly protein [Actinomycetes bacterium]|jgi:Flp pilus assembly pilin Flp|nr:MAG: hypothetical protein DIU67_09580 [Actinomycetota bacterium]
MKRLRRLIGRDERGATLIEFSLIFTLLLVLALGAFEYGMALRDWQSVTIATREGARVAASAANYGEADCTILEATAGALRSFRSGVVREVHIFKSDEDGGYSAATANRYRPLLSGESTAGLSLVACGASTWVRIAAPWPPAARLNPSGDPFWIGVRLIYDHPWQTNFLWWNGTVQWTDDAVFRIEPPPPNA